MLHDAKARSSVSPSWYTLTPLCLGSCLIVSIRASTFSFSPSRIWKNTPSTRRSRSVERARKVSWLQLPKRLDCLSLVVFHVEDRIELSNLKQVVHFLGQVQQFHLAALVAHRGKGGDQFADARAVYVADVAQIQQDFLLSLRRQVLDGVAQNRAALAQCDASSQVNDGNVVHLPGAC